MPTLAVGIDIAAPTLHRCAGRCPPGGLISLGAARREIGAPTLRRCAGRCPPGGLISLGAARREIAPTLATRSLGFTLLELMVVVAIMALATAGVALSLRDGSVTALEREAQRLGALLESARAQSRMRASPVRWRNTETGFVFEGLPVGALPGNWLGNDVRADATTLLLGPEPIIGPQKIVLVSISSPQTRLTLATDGVRPFAVQTNAADGAP
ncbi:MAG: prepilin-type N-terminal cleavage/methylation domain-containing protein [Burkholderiales bacterium]|nr:prepilin-type N-terminal cleavage/methylation domain-containing protein [Burkholderiales bacterium]